MCGRNGCKHHKGNGNPDAWKEMMLPHSRHATSSQHRENEVPSLIPQAPSSYGQQIPATNTNTNLTSGLTAFCGVSSSEYDIKLMTEGVIPFSKGVASNPDHPKISIDEFGEVFTFEVGGLYRFVLDMMIEKMSGRNGCLKLSISGVSEEHQYLTLLPVSSTGHQHTSTTVPIVSKSKVSIRQTGQSEMVIKAGSAKLQIYRVG